MHVAFTHGVDTATSDQIRLGGYAMNNNLSDDGEGGDGVAPAQVVGCWSRLQWYHQHPGAGPWRTQRGTIAISNAPEGFVPQHNWQRCRIYG